MVAPWSVSAYKKPFQVSAWAALSSSWKHFDVANVGSQAVVMVLLLTYVEENVSTMVSCAKWESGDTIAVGCEILYPTWWPPFTLQQVHRHVRNGCIIVINCFNLLEAQSCIIVNQHCFSRTVQRITLKKWRTHALTFPSTFDPWS